MELLKILQGNDERLKKALFLFSKDNTKEEVILKFNLWSRYFFPRYFTSPDAPFHKDIDESNIEAYWGEITSFVDVAFRGAAKTARTKLFMAYAIANDTEHFRKYIKVLSSDTNNSTQIVTDIYNMLVAVSPMYPELFKKTSKKREERMSSLTTSTGVKITAGTVGTDQRGAIQEENRQDLIWYEDFENRTTLRSARKTKAISENMEEARTGLAVGGSCIYTCNYISEAGIVHILVTKKSEGKKVLVIPIMEKGKSTWERYTLEDIEQMKQTDDDFWGERMCKPSAGRDVLFNRQKVEKQIPKQPVEESLGLKIFVKPAMLINHRIATGHDVAGGVGLDSSTTVAIDFDVYPAQVVATFESNTIKPDMFGYEIKRQVDMIHAGITAIEKNNHGHATIAIAKQQEINQFFTEGKETMISDAQPREYGWHTNALTKPKMLFAFSKAVEDSMIELNDEELIQECKSYTRNDLIDTQSDPRLTTRHFDKLIAAAIAYQMKDEMMCYNNEEPLNSEYQSFK